MARVSIEDLDEEKEISSEEMKAAVGGAARILDPNNPDTVYNPTPTDASGGIRFDNPDGTTVGKRGDYPTPDNF